MDLCEKCQSPHHSIFILLHDCSSFGCLQIRIGSGELLMALQLLDMLRDRMGEWGRFCSFVGLLLF